MHPNGVSGAGWITLWVSVLALSALAGVSVLPRAAAQQKVIIRFGHAGFPDSLFESTAEEFAKRVNKELAGRVEVRVFQSRQLDTDEDMLQGVRVRPLEIFLPSMLMSSVEDGLGVFEM